MKALISSLKQSLMTSQMFRSLSKNKTSGGFLAACTLGAMGFAFDLFSMREDLCRFPFPQPQLSDVCGSINSKWAPVRAERVAWAHLISRVAEQGEIPCGDFESHLKSFPSTSYYQNDIERKMAAARTKQAPGFNCNSTGIYDLYQDTIHKEYRSQTNAKQALVAALVKDAQRACSRRVDAEPGSLKLIGSPELKLENIECDRDPSVGWVCRYDDSVSCDYARRCLIQYCF